MAPSRNVETATALLRGLAAADLARVTEAVSPDRFIQHDSAVAEGVASWREHARGSGASEQLDIGGVLEDSGFVVLHGRTGIGTEGQVFFTVFRFDGGVVVEHCRSSAPIARTRA